MDRFEEMQIFVEVVRQKSLTVAAGILHISPSKVSQALSRLENRIRVQLIIRTTRKTQITPEGKAYFDHCVEMLEKLENEVNEIRDTAASYTGKIRIDAASVITKRMLLPVIQPFFDQFPEIAIEFIHSEHLVDLGHLKCDLMIRVGPVDDSSLIGISLGHSRCIAVAAPSYLERHGEPEKPESLKDHNCIQFIDPHSGRISPWIFYRGKRKLEVKTKGNVMFNEAESAFASAVEGGGILYTTEAMIRTDLRKGALRRVLVDWEGTSHQVILAYSKTNYGPVRIQAFVEFLRKIYAADTNLDAIL